VDASLVHTIGWQYHTVMADTAGPTTTDTASAQKSARPPLEWEAHEYLHTEKAPDWYWALGLIAIAGAVAALTFNNVLFAVFILIAAFFLAIFAARKPNTVRFAVTQRGVRIDDLLYPFSSLESFAIDELTPEHTPKLILESRKIFVPRIVIPIEGVSADDVHDFLLDFLHEEDHVEPLTHHFMGWLGF
jgi:hypothetical protein